MTDQRETGSGGGDRRSPLDRLLGVFSDVRAGEGTDVLLMFLNIFTILVGYYVIKTVREPLIINTGGAEVKAYSAAGQAVVLMAFIPLYSWFASRVDRMRLIVGFNLFFIVCIELFFLAGRAEVPYTGVVFFIWVGIFNNAVVAQFWSYANDVYSRSVGERVFPIIVIGMTAGTPVGSKLAEVLFDRGVDPFSMMQLGVVALVVSLVLYQLVERRTPRRKSEVAKEASPAPPPEAMSRRGGFSLVFGNRYLLLIALTLVLANWVNTTGEYILDRMIEAEAALLPEAQRDSFVGAFRGNFYFWVNIATMLIQAFLVSRIVRYLGIAGVIFALPVVALGAYGLIATGVSFAVIRWAKTAENSTDYSVMNTAKAMLWLPATREEKYKAKQATDTFFVRVGDLLQAVTVFVGTTVIGLGVAGFAAINVALVAAWLFVSWRLFRENRALIAERGAEPERAA